MRKPSSAIVAKLQQAVGLHNAGDRHGAAKLYRQVLASHPLHPDALHLLGLACHQLGDHASAVRHLQLAVREKSDVPQFHNHLGEACRAMGRREEARACYERALRLDGRFPEALNNLGIVLKDAGDLAGAAARFEAAVQARPGYFEASANLGTTLLAMGKARKAAACIEQALRLNPRAMHLLEPLAHALLDAGDAAHAERRYREAFALYPDRINLLAGQVVARQRQGRHGQAVDLAREALLEAPENGALQELMILALRGAEKLQDAEAYLRKRVAADPDNRSAARDLGMVLADEGRLEEALAHLESLVARWPEDPEMHSSLALVLLLAGDYARGWEEYEWRLHSATFADRCDLPRPVWDGESPGRVLVHAEQGAGDTFQFVRFLPDMAARGATVLLQAPAALLPALARIDGVSTLLDRESPLPAFDFHLPLLSLPRLLGLRLEHLPVRSGYLSADPGRTQHWRARLASDGDGLKVGLAWTGSPLHANNARRSCPPEMMQALAVSGVRFYSLQKDCAPPQALADALGLVDCAAELTDFGETAALVAALDLVVSVDTSVVHLAGALGKPVWVLLPHASEWRWLTSREDSPWYPSARLYRQPAPGDWDGVLKRVATDLAAARPGALPSPSATPAVPAARRLPVEPVEPMRLRRCRHGLMLYNRNDQYVGRSLELYGEFSEAELALFAELLRPGDVVVEAGANIGAHTLPLARLLGPGGRLVAYEPQRLAFQTLCANLALNAVENVEARPAALGEVPGSARVPALAPRCVANFGGVSLGAGAGGEPVAVETIDQLELARCRLLKADVEGMEAVVRGAQRTIARSRPLLYLENDRPQRSAELIGLVRGLGYRLWWHLPPLFRADNHDGNAENVFGGLVSINLLCVPDETPFSSPLRPVLGPDDWPI